LPYRALSKILSVIVYTSDFAIFIVSRPSLISAVLQSSREREIAETKRKGGRGGKIERGKRGQKYVQASSAATLAMYKSHLVMTMTPGDGDEE